MYAQDCVNNHKHSRAATCEHVRATIRITERTLSTTSLTRPSPRYGAPKSSASAKKKAGTSTPTLPLYTLPTRMHLHPSQHPQVIALALSRSARQNVRQHNAKEPPRNAHRNGAGPRCPLLAHVRAIFSQQPHTALSTVQQSQSPPPHFFSTHPRRRWRAGHPGSVQRAGPGWRGGPS